jgi:ubiquinone biosynthesis protein UbiJ
VEGWARGVDALRDDTERLGQRLEQLERRIERLTRWD